MGGEQLKLDNTVPVSRVRQTGLLLKKNGLVKRRDWRTSISELLLPIIFCVFLVLIRRSVKIDDIEGSSNLNSTQPFSDIASLTLMYASLACGQLGRSGNLATGPSVFAVASSNETLRLDFGDHVQRTLVDVLTLTNTTTYECSEKPLLCGFFRGDSAPEECRLEYETRDVNIVDYINSRRFMQEFETREGMDDYFKHPEYASVDDRPPVLFAASFPDGTGVDNQWEYVIHGNRSKIDSEVTDDTRVGFSNNEFTKYLRSGFMFFQALVDSYIIKGSGEEGSEYFQQLLFVTQFAPFPVPSHKYDEFASLLRDFIGLYFTITVMWPFTRMVRNIVQDKEDRVKEGLRTMGVSNLAFWLSWALTYFIVFTLLSVVMTLVLIPVFKYSNMALVFVCFWTFTLACGALACTFGAIFSASKTAGTLSLAVLVGMWLLSVGLNENASLLTQIIFSLAPPTTIHVIMARVLTLESAFVGLQTDNFAQGAYSVELGVIMLLFDTVLYCVLAWYFDNTIKSPYGTNQRSCFCLRPSFWRKAGASNLTQKSTGSLEIPGQVQAVSASLAPNKLIALRGLRKTFPTRIKGGEEFVAVEGLDLDIYTGQIFVLLGHNGAGKSTTINMLTGMVPISKGLADMGGYDANLDMSTIRRFLGVCHQHDILFPSLTVKEHLDLYARLKGVSELRLAEVVSVAIAEVQLEAATDQRAGSLSGGQKRRLSLAIALIGDSKVIFLDEPTSGVDPFSRRAIWDLLQKKKAGRVIILTTHFMDEADQLGDRIAIMHHGKLRCCGTSLFLKNMFGVGYNVIMSCSETADRTALSAIIRRFVPTCAVLSDVGTELSYTLPLSASVVFPELLLELEGHGVSLGCESFGMSVTTLEEVFLRVARDEEIPEDTLKALNTDDAGGQPAAPRESGAAPRFSDANPRFSDVLEEFKNPVKEKRLSEVQTKELDVLSANKPASFWMHFKALFLKRWHNAKRDRRSQMCQFVVPAFILLAGLLLLQYAPSFARVKDINLSFSEFNQPMRIPVNQNIQFRPPFAFAKLETEPVYPTEMLGTSADWVLEEFEETWGDDLQGFSDLLLDSRLLHKESRYGAVCYGYRRLFLFQLQLQAGERGENTSVTSDGGQSGPGAGVGGDASGRLDRGENGEYIPYPYTIFTNRTARLGMPMFWNVFAQGRYREDSGDYNATIKMKVAQYPLTSGETKIYDAFSGLTTAIIVAIAFSFVPAAYIVFIVKEKEVNSKHLQLISGVNLNAYWLSNYAFDMCLFLASGFLCSMLIYLLANEVFTKNMDLVILNIFLYGLAVIPFTYLLSFLFESASTAQNFALIIYILSGVVMLIASFVFFSLEDTQDIADEIRFFFRLFPNFGLGDTFLYVSFLELRNLLSLSNDEAKETPWDLDISGWNLIFLSAESIVFFALVLSFEHIATLRNCCKSKVSERLKHKGLDQEEDEDVEKEKRRVQEAARGKELIQLNGLRKAYPQKVAVNDLHFSIPKNQCFGFLGVNGAGKSTTLKMLTGDEVPTQGDAYLGGLSITKDKVAVRRLMGYCPQHDAVHDLMTGEETLEFYGRLRGVPPHKLPAMVSYLAKRLTLDQDNQHKRPAGTYSGGNRRKLSVGIALIGNPPVVFLDEPSTGMDPLSRRFMWDFIASTMAERAVILTTHSMEECEALCSRIGILVHGRLRCIGPAQRLKDRYGNGFEFALTVQDGSVPAARAFVNDTFESVKEIECYGGSIKFQLGKQRVPLSAIFRLLEGNKDRVGILEYSIGQATLEQIFINMAAKGDREVAHEALGDVTRHKLAQLEEVKLEPMPERTSDELALPQSQSSKLNVLTRPQSQGSNGLPQEPALRLTETESDPAIVVPPVARSDSPTNSHPENI